MVWRARTSAADTIPRSEMTVLVAIKRSLGGDIDGSEEAVCGAGQSSPVLFCRVLGLSLVEVTHQLCSFRGRQRLQFPLTEPLSVVAVPLHR